MTKRLIDFKNVNDLHAAEIKASLYAGGNLSKMVRKAIKSYSESLPKETVKQELTFQLQYQNKNYNITILDVPHLYDGEDIHENLILSATLERIIGQKIQAGSDTLSEDLKFHFQDLLNVE